MSRPGFARGLGPSFGELLLFLAWLAFVAASMTAMIRVPAFNLLFWPSLWTYDFWRANQSRNSFDPSSMIRLGPVVTRGSLWDRELDG